MIIKNIFEGKFGEDVHVAFLKFGRGSYRDKYLIEGKRQAKNWSIKTGPEYSNFLVKRCLESSKDEVKATGVIVSTLDLQDEINFELKKVSNFQGVRKHVVDGMINKGDIFSLMDKYPKAFFALSFKGDGFVLKIKPKAPTSGKPGKEKDGGPSADFCALKTDNEDFVKELFFDAPVFESIKIRHEIEVTDIVYPSNMENLKPAEIRELAKRKGVVKRIIDSDGKVSENSAEFVA